MTSSLRVDTEDWKKAAKGLRGADKEVKKAVNVGLRKVGLPVGKFISVAAGSVLPQRGGLGYEIGGARPGLTVGAEKVTIRWNVPGKKWYLAQIDDGVLKHPIFGRPKSTVEQKIPAGSFRKPFDESAPLVRRELITQLEHVLDGIGTAT